MRTSNFIHVTGNLGGEVEIKSTERNIDVARISIAEKVTKLNADRSSFEQVHTNWIPVIAFGSLARRASKSLKKGDRVVVLGSLKTSSFEKDGKNHRSFEVIAHSIEKAQLLAAQSAVDAGKGDSEEFNPMGEN